MSTDLTHVGPVVEKSRPWLALREGETLGEWLRRMNHTCYRCGLHEANLDALDRHENEHSSPAR